MGGGAGSVTVTKYGADGDSLWTMQYVAPNSAVSSGLAAVLDTVGNLYVTGTIQDTGSSDVNFLTIKYSQAPVDVPGDGGPSLPSQYALRQNYPNPFNPETQIEFTLPRSGAVQLEVLNLLGQRVKKIVDGQLMAGKHRYEWAGTDEMGRKAASGMYFYRLQADGFASTKKMILLR